MQAFGNFRPKPGAYYTQELIFSPSTAMKSCSAYYTVCLEKTGPLQLISHNFTNSQFRTFHFSVDYDKKYLNWLRTSCVVSITTIAMWHTWTPDFWADFEQRIIGHGRAFNEWQNDCGTVTVSAESQYSNTCCNCWCCKTFIIPTETPFV